MNILSLIPGMSGMSAIPGISAIPWAWRIALGAGLALILGAAGALAAWKGYTAGYEKAEALGRTAVAELKSAYDAALAEEMARLNDKLRAQTRTALAVSNALAMERTNNAKQQAKLRAQIAAVTRDSGHTFSPGFVRVFNEAIGAVPDYAGGAVPASGDAPGVDGKTGTGETVGTGILARGGKLGE